MSELSGKQRLEAQFDEVESKKSKLTTFIKSKEFEVLNERERELMISHLVALSEYSYSLLLRLEDYS